ncbi:NUT family member 1 [Oryctolagus cuniculus]|uniref:NUT family member 1 n=1 Tax=Oryctolagus cuniculus TaxID=9986 RepID=UPI00387A0164
MASDGTSPLPGPDMTMKPGAALSPFAALPFPPPTPGPPDQPPWDPPPQPPVPSAFSGNNPLVLSAFPSPLLMTGDGIPGPSGAGASKVIVTVKTEGSPAEPSQAQNFILTPTAINWIASDTEGPPTRFVTASTVKAILPPKAAGMSQEGPSGLPPQAPAQAAQLAPMVPLEKAWPGPQGSPEEGDPATARSQPPLGDLSCTSKGVYENFRRWQRYKSLARRHLSQSPDTEALSCFLIPVLRSLARLKPTMTLEEGLPRAVQEWERTSNFDRMIFYEMAEKFMEFEAEEEMQIQNTQLLNGSQGLSPAAPLKRDPAAPLAPEVCQQPVYIPKKTASKARAPRRRQRKPQKPPVPEAPKEIPPEAVKEYADIMEGLVGSFLATGESNGKWEEEEEQQDREEVDPDPDLLSYIDELCSQEVFVSKVEAVIHPRFLADLLSPEQQRDPLALLEELEQEEGLTVAQLVQKRLLALEEEDGEALPSCSGAQSDSSPSVSDEEEDVGGRLRPSPGSRGAGGTPRLGKAASAGKRAREVHGGQERAVDDPRWVHRDGDTLTPSGSWDLQLELAAPQGIQASLGLKRRGSAEVIQRASPRQDDHVGSAACPGCCPVADRTSEALPLCWREDPQPKTSCLDVRLAELAPLREPGLEKQVLGCQGAQTGALVPWEGSSETIWGNDQDPPGVPGYDQNRSPRAARAREGASLSPGLWLPSEIDAVSLELPLQIKEVIENFQDGGRVTALLGGSQALGSESNFSLGPGEAVAPGDVGSSVLPCGGTGATPALEKRNCCSLPGPLRRAKSPALRPKENREQSAETLQDPRGLWAEGCSPRLESRISVPTMGSSAETLLPACQDSFLVLGTRGNSFPEASQVTGDRGDSFSPLLETTEHVHILGSRDDRGLQIEVSKDTGWGEGREKPNLSKRKGPALKEHLKLHTQRAPKSASPKGLVGASPRWGTRNALALRETSPVSERHSSAHGARGKEKEKKREQRKELDEEDEDLSNFAYLLASKLSLAPRALAPSPQHTSGGQGVQRASQPPSAEERGLGQPLYPVAKAGKRALVGGSAPTEKRACPDSQLRVSGEKPSALGVVVRASQPRKRRRDTSVTGRRKKRRRSQ